MHFLEYLTKETFRLGEWFDVYYEVFTAQAICSTIAELQLQKIKEENHAGGSYTENDCPCFQVLKADRRCTEKSHEDVSEYSGWFYISCPVIWKSLFISAFYAYRIIISVETLVKTATHRRCGKVLTNIPAGMDKSSSTKEVISEYRNSDFQFSGSAISSHKNIHSYPFNKNIKTFPNVFVIIIISNGLIQLNHPLFIFLQFC